MLEHATTKTPPITTLHNEDLDAPRLHPEQLDIPEETPKADGTTAQNLPRH
jgi:hypothetical protein